MNPVLIIPARMRAARLPGKPLALIGAEPMIVHVWRRAVQAGVGPVWVACAEEEIAAAVEQAGGRAVLTDPDLPSGSDRIAQAARRIDPRGAHDMVVNVQGDMPLLNPSAVRAVVEMMHNQDTDIATAAAVIASPDEANDPSVVKAIVSSRRRALYFTRVPVPYGYHHIGLYAYRRAALERFVALAPSPLEQAEKLEQLRALEAGMAITVAIVDDAPLGVDTPDGLEKARRMYERSQV